MSSLPSHIFRGYDLRGLADTELTDDNVQLIAKAYATFLYRLQINEAVVGYDCRISSERVHKAFCNQLLECGINVTNIGLTLSQIMYFAQYRYLSKAGVMITASHNPAEYNGMKLGIGFSDTMITEEIQETRRIAQEEDFEYYQTPGKMTTIDVYPEYEKDLLKRVQIKTSYKIVVDACNATTGVFLPKFLRAAGHTVVEQNCNVDGTFPSGTPDPTEKHVLERLAKRVVAEGADVGFAYDCDGDRIGIVDGNGRFVWNDNLVSIFAKDIISHLPGAPIVYNTLCSKQVTEVIEQAGGKPVMWLTGHSFIKAKVKDSRAPFGGELSGHFFFMDNFYGHDDAAFASMRLLSYLDRTAKSLAQAIDELPQYISSPEIKFGCPDDRKFQFIANEITAEFKQYYPNAKYLDIDGIRMDTDNEMAIIRASQNGPYITLKFEGKTHESYDQLKHQMKEILQKYPEVDFASGVNVDALE